MKSAGPPPEGLQPSTRGIGLVTGATAPVALRLQEPTRVVSTCEEVIYLAGIWARRRLKLDLLVPGREIS